MKPVIVKKPADLNIIVKTGPANKVIADVPAYLPSHTIAQHKDVLISSPGAQNVLWYDAGQQKWVNTIAPWITIPDAEAQFYPNTNPAGYITGFNELDPVFLASPAAGITAPQISQWNAGYALAHSAVSIGTANGLSLAGQVLSLQTANTSQAGALSSGDWNTFNAKAPKLAANGIGYVEGTGFKLGGTLTENTIISGGAGASGKQLTLALATGLSLPSLILGSYNAEGIQSWIYGYDSSNRQELMRLESNTASADFILRVRNGSAPRTIRISAGINDNSYIDLSGVRFRAQNSKLGIGATFAAGSSVDARLHIHGDTNTANQANVIFERFDRAKTMELMGDHQAKFYGQIYATTGNLRLDQTIAVTAGAAAGFITININGTNYKIQLLSV